MNRIYLFLLFAGTLFSCSNPQPKVYSDYSNSSGYTSLATDSSTLENLEVLCRVWGYTKYHHPTFADSLLNMDYELFELLPKIAQEDKDTRNKVLYTWISGLGEFEHSKKFYQEHLNVPHEFINNYDWTSNTAVLGDELSQLLIELRYAKRKSNTYISQVEGQHIAQNGIKEAPYADHSSKYNFDSGFRLLQLFRYWTIIDSYCPNRNITDTPWDDVLREYIPRVINEKGIPVILELISELDDTHAYTESVHSLFGNYIAPIAVNFFKDKLIVIDTNTYNEFQVGDEIISVAGLTVPYLIAREKKYVSNSNKATVLRGVTTTALLSKKGSVLVEYIRDGKKKQVNVKTISYYDYYHYKEGIKRGNKKAFRMLDDSIGYINAGILLNKDGERIMDSLKNTKAVIVDIRNYPTNSIHFAFFGKYFFPTPKNHVIWKQVLVTLPGYVYLNSHEVGGYDIFGQFKDNPSAYGGKVVILVNEQTQSSAEYLAMLIQARQNTTTVGSQTAGADGNVVTITLPGNIKFWFSGLGVLYPDGTDSQRNGVKVDVVVYPTLAGIKSGRDEVLAKALEFVD